MSSTIRSGPRAGTTITHETIGPRRGPGRGRAVRLQVGDNHWKLGEQEVGGRS